MPGRERDEDADDRQFVTVARVGDIPAGRGRQVTIRDRCVGLFNLDGEYHALDDVK